MNRLVATAMASVATLGLTLHAQVVFRSNADEVLVDVSVLRGKAPVTGLKTAQFELTDNGVRQTIQDAGVNPEPIDVTLVIQREAVRTDVVTDMDGRFTGFRREILNDAVDAAAQGARRLIQPADGLRVITADDDVRFAVENTPRAWRASSVLDGLAAAMMLKPTEVGRRQLVIGLTGGTDNRSFVPADSRMRVALRSEAVVHLIALGQGVATFAASWRSSSGALTGTMYHYGVAAAPLRPIADATGGRFYQIDSSTDVEKMLKPAIDEFRTRYLLRYVPAGVVREGWHDIVVTVPSGSFDIRHRRGYEVRLPDGQGQRPPAR